MKEKVWTVLARISHGDRYAVAAWVGVGPVSKRHYSIETFPTLKEARERQHMFQHGCGTVGFNVLFRGTTAHVCCVPDGAKVVDLEQALLDGKFIESADLKEGEGAYDGKNLVLSHADYAYLKGDKE